MILRFRMTKTVYLSSSNYSKEDKHIHTPLLQKIFLYLDPKSLKNCKLTCSQWKEFIDREIWKSISAKKVLYRRLMSNWKDENFVTVNKINLEHRLLYIKGTGFACDENVMVFGGATEASVYRSLTLEKLYSVTLPAIYFTHIGDDFIAFISEQVMIIFKNTLDKLRLRLILVLRNL